MPLAVSGSQKEEAPGQSESAGTSVFGAGEGLARHPTIETLGANVCSVDTI